MSGAGRRAWLGLGGNIGDVSASMNAALDMLDTHPGIAVKAVSDLYETPPWGVSDQPAFLNACAEISTVLPPEALLAACLDAERDLKRVRSLRWGPRTIDVDILAMDDTNLQTEELTIPHPRMQDRAFVLIPLVDLAPGLEFGGKCAADWLQLVDQTGVKRVKSAREWRNSSSKKPAESR
ncbi:MAG: 2-amino-4-hydroxy-6-hydroxymethyldihydropteridine diphosphokinase [Nitratireductor sp.]